MAQATSVAGFIRRFLGSMHSQAASVGRLVVYYVKTAADDASRLRSLFLQEFGTAVQIVPVAIPHFYYEGMLIEVDVFASDARLDLRTFCDAQSGITFDVTDAGQFFWATLTIPRSFDRAAKSIIDSLLARANFLPERVLTEQWFVPASRSHTEIGLTADHAGLDQTAVRVSNEGADTICELTFAKTPVVVAPPLPSGGLGDQVSISLRQADGFFHLTGFEMSGSLGLVEQTAAIMLSAEEALKAAGLEFQNVRKSTTYYVAGSSADELHDNMAIRNGYYAKPGPASTGLPVEGLPQSGALISISLFGVGAVYQYD